MGKVNMQRHCEKGMVTTILIIWTSPYTLRGPWWLSERSLVETSSKFLVLVCPLTPSKCLGLMNPLQPTWIGRHVLTRMWAYHNYLSCSRSKYQNLMIIIWYAWTKFDSWHIISSKRETDFVGTLQMTMSGMRSVIAIYGGGRERFVDLEGWWW